MRDYELVTVISPEVDEERLTEVVDKVGQFIVNRDGAVGGTEKWGRRRLAYPVRDFMEADYVLTRFSLEPGLLKGMEAEVTALGDVLRHLVVKV